MWVIGHDISVRTLVRECLVKAPRGSRSVWWCIAITNIVVSFKFRLLWVSYRPSSDGGIKSPNRNVFWRHPVYLVGPVAGAARELPVRLWNAIRFAGMVIIFVMSTPWLGDLGMGFGRIRWPRLSRFVALGAWKSRMCRVFWWSVEWHMP